MNFYNKFVKKTCKNHFIYNLHTKKIIKFVKQECTIPLGMDLEFRK
jgi:hypothetical protein